MSKMENTEDFSTFDTLRPHFYALARVAYFKIVLKSVSPVKQFLHNVYRVIVWILVLLYNLQHIIRVIQVSKIGYKYTQIPREYRYEK